MSPSYLRAPAHRAAPHIASRGVSRQTCLALWLLVAAFWATLAPQPARADEPSPLASSVYGVVTVDDGPVPDGTQVTAYVDGTLFAEAFTTTSVVGSSFVLHVPADIVDTTVIEGATQGATVSYRVGGGLSAETSIWQTGEHVRLDLSAILGSDLTISITDDAETLRPGESSTYLITATNEGPLDVTGLLVTASLPAGALVVSATDGGVQAGSEVQWPAVDVPAGATRIVSMTVAAPEAAGPSQTTFDVAVVVADDGTTGLDPDTDNNSAVDTNAFDAAVDLVLSKTDNVSLAQIGQFLDYVITVRNDGDRDAATVALTDQLPEGVTFFTASGDGGETSPGLVTWPAFDLPASGEVTRTIRVRFDEPPSSEVLINTATAFAGNGPDRDASDNQATDETGTGGLSQIQLRAEGFDDSALVTDQQTLESAGSVSVTLWNRGAEALDVPIQVSIFEDLDQDGLLSPDDTVLGTVGFNQLLDPDQAALVDVPISGSVSFYGTVLRAFVDSGFDVAESDESDNYVDSGAACAALPTPGVFSPVVELSWPADDDNLVEPLARESMSTPIVVQLTDDNGDGRMDQDDVPDIVFVTIDLQDQVNLKMRLRAIRGDTGDSIFATQPPLSDFKIFTLSGMAAGDLTGDGDTEIVVSMLAPPANVVSAYDHRGRLLWHSDVFATHPAGTLTNRDNPTLADLDGDGDAEIIIGANVFDHTGNLLWTGSGGQAYQSARNADGADSGAISVVADLDMDGSPEVVTGNTAYRADGTVYWQVAEDDGYPAIGNFDADDFPEVVVVARGFVRLHDHDGTLLWGPVNLPGVDPEAGGAPTVADFDADGAPEIGVAGSDFYVVFETDGSVRWQRSTQDDSSNQTGSTVYDLDGDGSFEVIYRDETHLRILAGDDGQTLFEDPLSSLTANEMPVVADVDGDGAAEIVVTSDLAPQISAPERTYGLRVYGDALGNWLPTRKIWNQHSYHGENVTESGVIPATPEHFWLTHNTFRANLPPENVAPDASSDLTASHILLDYSEYPQLNGTVRIGNGGALAVPAGAPVAIYDADPATGGLLLEVASTTRSLAPGEFEDVEFSHVLTGPGTFFLAAQAGDDGGGTLVMRDCDSSNNLVVAGFDTTALGLTVALADGVDAVQPGDVVAYDVEVTNFSDFSRGGVVIEAQLPSDSLDVSASAGGVVTATASGPVVTWPAIDLGPTAEYAVVVQFRVDPAVPTSVIELTTVATVIDDGSQPDPTPDNNQVADTNRVLSVQARISGPATLVEGEEGVFDGLSSTDRDGTVVSYEWDLDADGIFDDATGDTVSYAFGDDSIYSVALRVTDDSGESDVDSAEVTVSNAAPAVSAPTSASAVEGTAVDLEVTFVDGGTADSHVASLDWGDGTVVPVDLEPGERSFSAIYVYRDDGQFLVEVCIGDDDGATGCAQTTVTVTNDPPTVLDDDTVWTADEGELLEMVRSFKDLGADDEHTADIAWGDGTSSVGYAELAAGAGGVTLFQDDFNDENGGVGRLNYTGFALWNVTSGAVDLIGNGFFDFLRNNGLFIDLDGSSGEAGTLRSSSAISLPSASYLLEFELAGSRRGSRDDTVIARFGDFVEETITLPGSASLETYSFPFSVGQPDAAFLEFQHLGGDNAGLLLDNVRIVDSCLLIGQNDPGGGDAICGLAGGEHVYADDGPYELEICVSDDDGGIDCGTAPVEIRNVLPVVDAGEDRLAVSTEPAELAVSFLDPGFLDPHTAEVDWGDGTVDSVPVVDSPEGGSLVASHAYAAEGDYVVTVCVMDDDGVGCDELTIFWREPREDLAVELTATPFEVRPEQPVTSTITLRNLGTSDPGEVQLRQTLTPYLQVVSATGDPQLTDDTLVWTVPGIEFGNDLSFQVEYLSADELPFDTEVVLQANVLSSITDDDPTNDVDTALLLLWDEETPRVDPDGGDGGGPLTGVEGVTFDVSAVITVGPELPPLDDSFDDERDGRASLNYFGWANFVVTDGTVDLIGNGSYDYLRGNGLYVDLDGSSGNAGRFATREIYDVRPGAYELAFDLAGNQRHNRDDIVRVSFGSAYEEEFVVPRNQPFVRYERTIESSVDGEEAQLDFETLGSFDNVGALLDDVFFRRLCGLSATIDWGDGAVETFDNLATACDDSEVAGQHTYLEDGVYLIEICAVDLQGDEHCAQIEALIDNAPPVPVAEDRVELARQPFSAQIGPFTDLGVLDTHTATIDWGDGSQDAGVVDQQPGSGTVSGGHVYALPGTYEATLCVTDDEGDTGCDPFQVLVPGDPISPDLVVTKTDRLALDTDADGAAGPGDYLVYDFEIRNLGGAAATGVRLLDLLETGLDLVPGGIVPGNGLIQGSDPVDVVWDSIPAGATETVQLYVEILGSADGMDSVSNQATVTIQEGLTVLSDDSDVVGFADPTVTILVARPFLVLEKRDRILNDDGDGEAIGGDFLEYTLELTSTGSVPVTEIFLDDAVPTYATLVASSVETSLGVIVSDDPIRVDVGTLEPGMVAIVGFQVQLDDDLGGVEEVSNQALVTSAELADLPSDDPDTAAFDDATRTPVAAPTGEPELAASKVDALFDDARFGRHAVTGRRRRVRHYGGERGHGRRHRGDPA